MFERWNMEDLGEIAFIITPLVRHPVYKNPSLLNEWSGDVFNPILIAIKSHLMPTTTNNPKRKSWLNVDKESHFPIQNIPFAI